MKVSELWLREWVNPTLTREQLCEKLTMAGLEIDELSAVAKPFTHVVVAEVLSVTKHPEADKLNICEVNVGEKAPLVIVCGAANVRVGMKVPAALEGALLPNDFAIKQTKIRGVASHGMLCSAVELSLAEESQGLLELPQSAPVGEKIWDYLALNDYVMDVSITPNRGDCLSVLGLAKEISALTETALQEKNNAPVKPTLQETLKITLDSPQDCPRYVGRIIRGVKANAETPIWMQERLRRSGQRCISPVVDVMNYVMLELGQPMHAFDLQKISGDIHVRMAKESEEIALLDGQTLKLNSNTLVIADKQNPLAIAGVMGGLDSAVTSSTQDIFLESALFSVESVARSVRQYLLNSESSYRFERGIDPAGQVRAIERATELLLSITGGQAGPVIEVSQTNYLPEPVTISLRKTRITQLLGIDIPEKDVVAILMRLGFEVKKISDGWEVIAPSNRTDMKLEVDVIEEIMRLFGYDKLPANLAFARLQMPSQSERVMSLSSLRKVMQDLGFNEAITYSFVDKKIQELLDPHHTPKALVNPMTADMAVMRTNLWPGLMSALLYNQNRQQSRMRFFEIGMRFLPGSELKQEQVLSGIVAGDAFPEQWGISNRKIDFFDIKGDIENLLSKSKAIDEFSFKPSQHPALHPGQSADIYRHEKRIGVIGALHPSIKKELDVDGSVFVFELLLDEIVQVRIPRPHEVSKFPEIRRDIAILVDRTVPSRQIQDTIKDVAGELLKDVRVFDVYQGKEIASTHKSIALALTLQHNSRTLVDKEVAELMEQIIFALKEQFTAELRG